jgi:hypothetical protein
MILLGLEIQVAQVLSSLDGSFEALGLYQIQRYKHSTNRK